MRRNWLFVAMAAAVLAACVAEQPETPAVDPVESGYKVFRASFEKDDETRTALSMNAAGTHADVLWEVGDKIKVLALNTKKGIYSRDFTTDTGGSSVAEFGCDSWDAPSEFSVMAIYPHAKYTGAISFDYDGYYIGLAIPPSQKAVKGGVESGVLVSTAYNEDGSTDELHFRNALALVRFKLGGKNASKVRKVKLVANTFISGDCIYYPENTTFDMYSWYDTGCGGGQCYVDLTGTFEAGAEYYMAMTPQTLESFYMLFYDADGEYISKFSRKTLKLQRSRIADIGTIKLDDNFGELSDGVVRYMTHSKGKNPVCLAVVGDGFTSSEQNTFKSRAEEAMRYIFATEPFSTYRDYFNVYFMPVVSNESGASITNGNGKIKTARDTYFNARWGQTSYGDMAIDDNIVYNYVASHCPEVIEGEKGINEVCILALINDTRYGGICRSWSDGKCIGMVPYVLDGGSLGWRYADEMAASESSTSAGTMDTPAEVFAEVGDAFYGDWRNVALHEFGGHGFGRLTDEYWDVSLGIYPSTTISSHSFTVPMGLNVSAKYNDVPWQEEVLDNLAALPPIYEQRAGKYQGGNGYARGVWRSERISCMIDNRPYFATWQRILIVKRIMSLAGESFNITDFYDNDNPADPHRDSGYSAPKWQGVPYQIPEGEIAIYPPLPLPVLMD